MIDIPLYTFYGFYVLGFGFWLGVLRFLSFLSFLVFWGGLLWGFDFDFLVSFFCFSLVFYDFFNDFCDFCDYDFDCCCILHSTPLSSYVQPDDGRYGRNM